MVSAEDILHIDTLQWNSVCLQLKLTAADRVSRYYPPPSLSLSEKTQFFRNKLHCRSSANHNTENYKAKNVISYYIHSLLGTGNCSWKAEKVQFSFSVNELGNNVKFILQ